MIECSSGADNEGHMEAGASTLNQTTLLANEEEAFALEPVAVTRRHQ